MYKHVECEWENEEETFSSVLHDKKEFWLSWNEVTKEYMKMILNTVLDQLLIE